MTIESKSMENEFTVSIQKTAYNPEVDQNFSGIVVNAPAKVELQREKLCLHGTFQIKEEDVPNIGLELHRALVLLITLDGYSYTGNICRNITVFAEDEESIDGFRRGYFTVDVLEYSGLQYAGTYFVSVSIGCFVSNIVDTVVTI